MMVGGGALATLVVALFVFRGDAQLPGTGGWAGGGVDPEVELMRLYEEYNALYQRSFDEDKYLRWKQNHMSIEAKNAASKGDKYALKYKDNWSTDISNEEYVKHLTRIQNPDESRQSFRFDAVNDNYQYSEVDHAESGFVNKVKDQGDCDASWALTATTVLEGAIALKKKKPNPKRISSQEMIDCSSGSDVNVA